MASNRSRYAHYFDPEVWRRHSKRKTDRIWDFPMKSAFSAKKKRSTKKNLSTLTPEELEALKEYEAELEARYDYGNMSEESFDIIYEALEKQQFEGFDVAKLMNLILELYRLVDEIGYSRAEGRAEFLPRSDYQPWEQEFPYENYLRLLERERLELTRLTDAQLAARGMTRADVARPISV